MKLNLPAYLTVIIAFCGMAASCPPKPKQPPSSETETAILAIAKNRDAAENLVPRIKAKYKDKEEDPTYTKARDLYDTAKTENNSWATALAIGIENNQDLSKSKPFKDQAQVAADATKKFMDYGKSITQGPQPKFVIAGVGAAEIAKILVENGITIWKAYKGEQAKERKSQADSTKQRLVWSSWESQKS